MKACMSEKLPARVRAKMKSKGLLHVHSFSTSSISKEQFGGTLYTPDV